MKKTLKQKPKKLKFDRGVARAICDFAHEHGMVMNPAGYGYYINVVLVSKSCPCDPERKHCPCPESIEEVARDGHCQCRLLWRDYTEFSKGLK